MVAFLMVTGVVGAVLVPGIARADSAPLDPSNPVTPTTVTADPLPTVQINGVAWAQLVVGDTVYVAGSFTRARPAGAAPGTQETVRNNMLAYDIRTGALITSFAPDLNGQALALAASPDGSRVYVGGSFTQANGQARSRIAAYDTATGQLVSTFRPAANSTVRAVAATNSTVYLGGEFSAVGSTARERLAAVSASNGALLPWAPRPGVGSTAGNWLPNEPVKNAQTSNYVLAMVVAGSNGQVVVAGRFDSLNGVKATGVGALDGATGATRPFAVNSLITNQGVNSAIWSLSTDGTNVYGTGYDFYGPGNLEGSFAAAADGGAVRWINDCRGDTYSAFAVNGVVYHATHAHACSNIGGFPEQDPRVNMFGTSLSLAPAGTVGTATIRNQNFAGKPAPSVLPWYPTFYSGTYTQQYQAGWSVTGNRDYVVYGGEFPGVNGSEQQGLVRFAVPSSAPNRVAPRATGTFAPTVTMLPGAVRITWRAVHDRDNEHLTYRVYRDAESGTPVCQVTRPSQWWQLPTYGCSDTGAAAGSHRYVVVASDPAGNRLTSTWATATVGASNSSADRPYAQVVASDGAQSHWPLGETSGSLAYDRLGSQAQDMTVSTGVTRNQTGAIAGDTDRAYRFNGTSAGSLATQTAVVSPQVFTVEAWFQTTSSAGGKIVGFGNARTGLSTLYDRHVYMDAQGRVSFGVYNGAGQTITTSGAYNDGRWHHVAGSLGPAGLSLYVDGQLVGRRADVVRADPITGYWRVGGDRSWASGLDWFAGQIDEVAVYPTALSAERVAAHDSAGRTGQAPNVAPTAAFTAAARDLTVAVDATSSRDADGTVSTYAWDFGDGATGTGATASHVYAAAGTYTVRLTVTDDDGATANASREVTVAPAPAGAGSIAADAFGREVASGWGSADRGGAWTMGGGSNVSSVTGGAGQLGGGIGRGVSATLREVSAQDVAIQADLTLVQAATGGGTYVYLGGRQVAGDDYRATLRFRSTGETDLYLYRVIGGSETILATQRLAGTYTPGTALTVRLEIVGTALRAKAWPAGTAEPAAWTVTATDTTAALQRPGALFLDVYTSGTATRGQVVRLDNLRAERPGTVVDPAPNAAPTAAFTTSVADLRVSVDGSTSADTDGTVAGFAWDFGDGATGTGATASHTYAAAGTYTVRLTVTDDDGATGTVTRQVTVTAPAPEPGVQPVAADAFERSVTSGWGTADRGGAWTVTGSSAISSVTGGAGQLSGGIGRTVAATLGTVSGQDVSVQAEVTLPQAATGTGSWVSLSGRKVGTTDQRVTVRFQSTGVVDVRLDRTMDGAETVLASQRLTGTYTPGTALTVRLELEGTALRAKVWPAGTAEPAAWTVTATDTTAALQRPGALSLEVYTSSSATRRQDLRLDDLWVGQTGQAPPTP
ncbi:PKD domain-containing protein [Geodermatophilus sp. SYSU D00700]